MTYSILKTMNGDPMRALVTGAAGFIGSTLAEHLIDHGHEVRGVDCFTPYYDEPSKRQNVSNVMRADRFELVEADLRSCDIAALLVGVDAVFHLAAQPGVRLSWSDGFATYAEHNVLATQRLLEAVRATPVRRLVYASSSSVYGNASSYPTHEDDLPQPHSPYGVTKMAAEHLCNLYASNWGVPTVSLRYFTVYGPRQRPDMAMHRLVEAALTGDTFPLYGTGEQIRDFTFVDDVVRATALAGTTEDVAPGTVLNVAGGDSTTMNEVISIVESTTGRPVNIDRRPPAPGDVHRTGGTIELATQVLGWKPEVGVGSGIEAQAQWHMARHAAP